MLEANSYKTVSAAISALYIGGVKMQQRISELMQTEHAQRYGRTKVIDGIRFIIFEKSRLPKGWILITLPGGEEVCVPRPTVEGFNTFKSRWHDSTWATLMSLPDTFCSLAIAMRDPEFPEQSFVKRIHTRGQLLRSGKVHRGAALWKALQSVYDPFSQDVEIAIGLGDGAIQQYSYYDKSINFTEFKEKVEPAFNSLIVYNS